MRAVRRFQRSAEAIVRTRPFPGDRKGRTVKNKEELPMNSDRGARQQEFDSRLRRKADAAGETTYSDRS